MSLWVMRAVSAVLVLAFVSVGWPGYAQKSPPLMVFAAGSLKNVIDEAMARWKASTGQAVVASYSHAPGLAKQIEAGAPADIFISADNDWMNYLIERKLVNAQTRVNVAGNGLVLIAAIDDKAELKLQRDADLAGLVGTERIAVCTIASCPGGKYAKAALENLGLWESVRSRLIDQETVRVALAAVARKEVRFAIVYSTDAAIEPKVRIVDTFPESSHPAIIYPAAIVTGSKNPAANMFLDFLLSPEGSAIFARYGFRRMESQGSK